MSVGDNWLAGAEAVVELWILASGVVAVFGFRDDDFDGVLDGIESELGGGTVCLGSSASGPIYSSVTLVARRRTL